MNSIEPEPGEREPQIVGTVVRNSDGVDLLVPEAELKQIDRDRDDEASEFFAPGSEHRVTATTPAIAVYFNEYDQIVIRAEREWHDEHDQVVRVNPRDVSVLVKRLQKLAGEAGQ